MMDLSSLGLVASYRPDWIRPLAGGPCHMAVHGSVAFVRSTVATLLLLGHAREGRTVRISVAGGPDVTGLNQDVLANLLTRLKHFSVGDFIKGLDGEDAPLVIFTDEPHAIPLHAGRWLPIIAPPSRSHKGGREQTIDSVARSVHALYQQERIAQGKKPIPDYDDLSDEDRNSNRLLAAHMGISLRALGFAIVTAGEFGVDLDETEIRILAATEHDRWRTWRILNGWKWGQERDDVHKIHPDLVAFADLHPESRKMTLLFAGSMDAALADVGLGIKRELSVALTDSPTGTATRSWINGVREAIAEIQRHYPDRRLVLYCRSDCQSAMAAAQGLAQRGDAIVRVLHCSGRDTLPNPVATIPTPNWVDQVLLGDDMAIGVSLAGCELAVVAIDDETANLTRRRFILDASGRLGCRPW